MPRVLWVHAKVDSIASGELRRLGVPALLIDGEHWTCDFTFEARVAMAAKADVVVIPLQAINALPLLHEGAATKVVVEIDARAALDHPEGVAIVAGLSNRIAAVVARTREAAAWATRILDHAAPVWLVPDPAVRRVELAAAALHFGVPSLPGEGLDLADSLDLWFCEPGDYIEPDEVRHLAKMWGDGGEAERIVVAPRYVRAWLHQAGVRALNLEWSPETLNLALAKAKRCVFAGPEGHSQARRRVLALRSGAAAPLPVSFSAAEFEPTQVASKWLEILASVIAKRRPILRDPLQIMVFLDLIQDLDPILPLVEALRNRRDVNVQAVLTKWVKHRSPRVDAELSARIQPVQLCDRNAVIEGAAPSLERVDAVIAAAESSLSAHACSHALFNHARKAGIPTFVLQHGVENVGLHYVPGEDDATLAADYLFVWFPWDQTPASVPAPLRPRLVHVGRSTSPHPDLADIRGTFTAFDSVVTVFENLHWRRYDQAWRAQFLLDCTEFAFANPGWAVILKPHHAGLWSAKNRHLIPHWPSNLIVADPTDAFWEPFTATALVQLADAVITTPSTVALDAAQAGKPVAVGAYGLELGAYAPLPLLQRLEDWFTFVADAGSVEDAARRATFLRRTAVGDNPARDAANYIVTVAQEARQAKTQRLEEASS